MHFDGIAMLFYALNNKDFVYVLLSIKFLKSALMIAIK